MSIPTTTGPYTVGGTGDPFGGGGGEYVDPILLQTAAPTDTGGTTTTGPDPLWLQTTAPVTGGGTGTVDPTLLQGGGLTTDQSNPSWVQTNPITNTPALAGGYTGQVGGRTYSQEDIDFFNSLDGPGLQRAVSDGFVTYEDLLAIQNGTLTAGGTASGAAPAGSQANPIRPGTYFADAQIWDVGGPNDPFTNPNAEPKNYQQYYQNKAVSDAAFYADLESKGQLDAYWENMYADEFALLTGGDEAPPPIQQELPPQQQLDPRWLQEQNLTGSYASAMGNAGPVGLQDYYAPQQQQQQQVDQRLVTPQQIQPLYYY